MLFYGKDSLHCLILSSCHSFPYTMWHHNIKFLCPQTIKCCVWNQTWVFVGMLGTHRFRSVPLLGCWDRRHIQSSGISLPFEKEYFNAGRCNYFVLAGYSWVTVEVYIVSKIYPRVHLKFRDDLREEKIYLQNVIFIFLNNSCFPVLLRCNWHTAVYMFKV